MNYAKDYKGIGLAVTIIFTWFAHLVYCLTTVEISIVLPFHIWFQTFLTTGLFIVAHDSIHGSLAPNFKNINYCLGAFSIFLYAGFPYERMRNNHHKHHAHPTTKLDPDYTDKEHEDLLPWIWSFLKKYYGLREFLLMHIHVGIVYYIGGNFGNLLLFFAIPAWLSAFQLFYFGTYLPHKGFRDSKVVKTRTNNFPKWLSLITCYHFGYHIEHHDYPNAAWWELPAIKQKTSDLAKQSKVST